MGETEEEVAGVVADAGPLIHLDELDCLDLLQSFDYVVIPPAVEQEVARHRPRALPSGAGALRVLSTPSGASDLQLQPLKSALGLDAGGLAALSALLDLPGSVLLTDDSAARLAAKALGRRAHGTLGVLLRALRRGQRSQGEILALLEEMPTRSTLHVKRDLLNEVIAEVGRFDLR